MMALRPALAVGKLNRLLSHGELPARYTMSDIIANDREAAHIL